jgi:hypothetical protein
MLVSRGPNRSVPLEKQTACRDRNNTELWVREIRLDGTTSKKRDPKVVPYKFQQRFDYRHFFHVAKTNSGRPQQSLHQNVKSDIRRGKENLAAEILRAKKLLGGGSVTGAVTIISSSANNSRY